VPPSGKHDGIEMCLPIFTFQGLRILHFDLLPATLLIFSYKFYINVLKFSLDIFYKNLVDKKYIYYFLLVHCYVKFGESNQYQRVT